VQWIGKLVDQQNKHVAIYLIFLVEIGLIDYKIISMQEQNKKIVFVDSIGRTILGVLLEENDNTVKVQNPTMIVVQQTVTNQLQVQLMPLFFQEFIDVSTRKDGTVFEYLKTNITKIIDLNVDQSLLDHYNRIFNPSPIITPASSETPVIRLFED
jgi:hypothetical protein